MLPNYGGLVGHLEVLVPVPARKGDVPRRPVKIVMGRSWPEYDKEGKGPGENEPGFEASHAVSRTGRMTRLRREKMEAEILICLF